MSQGYCTFRVDGLLIGIDVKRVQEVIRDPVVAPIPLADPCVTGLINLRGQIAAAIDARTRLGLTRRADGDGASHVIIPHENEPVSLVVDTEDEVAEVTDDAYEPVPETLSERMREMLSATYKLPAGLLLVLDVDRVLTVT